MKLSSSAFAQFANIPGQFTCEGSNQSPPLTWSDVPKETKSLVLIVDDPDAPDPSAPKMTWVHWVLYNIPPDSMGISIGLNGEPKLPSGTVNGLND